MKKEKNILEKRYRSFGKIKTKSITIVKFCETPRGSDSLVNAMSSGDYPFGIDQHTTAPVTDKTQFRM